jgi:hypothetical protein
MEPGSRRVPGGVCRLRGANLSVSKKIPILSNRAKGHLETTAPASPYYLSHVLDPAGVRPRLLRSIRLTDLVSELGPKLVSAAFGMRPEGVVI